MKFFRCITAALALALGVAGHARAVSIPVPIDSLTNANLRTYTSGANYPIAPTTLTLDGVPFDLVPLHAVPNSLVRLSSPAS